MYVDVRYIEKDLILISCKSKESQMSYGDRFADGNGLSRRSNRNF